MSLIGIGEKQLPYTNKKPRQRRGSGNTGLDRVRPVTLGPAELLGVREKQLLSIHLEVGNRLLTFFGD